MDNLPILIVLVSPTIGIIGFIYFLIIWHESNKLNSATLSEFFDEMVEDIIND